MKILPRLIFKKDSDMEPEITIVIPVYNQEKNIKKVLSNIINNLVLTAQIIIINDNSSDETLNVITDWAKLENTPKYSFEIYSFKKSVYETACDSFGISIAKSRYIIEIQADMIITDRGFDNRLLEAITNRSDTLIISGKGTHTWKEASEDYIKSLGSPLAFSRNLLIFTINQLRGYTGNYFRKFLKIKNINLISNISNKQIDEDAKLLPNQIQFKLNPRAGILGSDIFLPHSYTSDQKRIIYYGETVMRGPVIIDKEKYFEIGGLDLTRFFLGGDDHDLTLRAWKQKKYRSGYTPLEFYSPILSGTTRKSRSLKQIWQLVWRLFKVRDLRKSSALYQYALNPGFNSSPEPEKTTY
jgi:glycosyltransferase involved in cell wall biosynthesis